MANFIKEHQLETLICKIKTQGDSDFNAFEFPVPVFLIEPLSSTSTGQIIDYEPLINVIQNSLSQGNSIGNTDLVRRSSKNTQMGISQYGVGNINLQGNIQQFRRKNQNNEDAENNNNKNTMIFSSDTVSGLDGFSFECNLPDTRKSDKANLKRKNKLYQTNISQAGNFHKSTQLIGDSNEIKNIVAIIQAEIRDIIKKMNITNDSRLFSDLNKVSTFIEPESRTNHFMPQNKLFIKTNRQQANMPIEDRAVNNNHSRHSGYRQLLEIDKSQDSVPKNQPPQFIRKINQSKLNNGLQTKTYTHEKSNRDSLLMDTLLRSLIDISLNSPDTETNKYPESKFSSQKNINGTV